jgi:hypothetical protein
VTDLGTGGFDPVRVAMQLSILRDVAERFIESCPAKSMKATFARGDLYAAIDATDNILGLWNARSDPEAFSQRLRDLAAAGVFDTDYEEESA